MFTWVYRTLILIGCALLVAAVVLWYQSDSGEAAIAVKLPENISVGVPFPLEVGVINNSDTPLTGAKLTITLPPGVSFVGSAEDRNILTRTVGDVGVAGVATELFDLIVLTPSSTAPVELTAAYTVPSASSRFEVRETAVIASQAPALQLKIEAPEEATSNDEFKMNIVYTNSSEGDFEQLWLEMEYPPVFTFIDASVDPDEGKRRWDLGRLNRGAEQTLSISGRLVAPAHSVLDVRAALKARLQGQEYTIARAQRTITIKPASFDFRLDANNSDDFVASAGETVQYTLTFSEALDSVRVQLSGDMIDFGGGGSVLTWERPQSPLSFPVRVKQTYPLRRLGDKNFLIKVTAEGRRGKDVNVARLETKVGGQTTVAAKGYFRDAQAGILNKGPLPPKAGAATEFTVHWRISNFGTDVRDVVVRAPLAEGVEFTGVTKSTIAAKPVYDPKLREVLWQIDRLLATQGALDTPIEAIFQIRATPHEAMVGKYMPLVGEVRLSAVDEFTGKTLTAPAAALTTALPDDTSVGAQGVVVK